MHDLLPGTDIYLEEGLAQVEAVKKAAKPGLKELLIHLLEIHHVHLPPPIVRSGTFFSDAIPGFPRQASETLVQQLGPHPAGLGDDDARHDPVLSAKWRDAVDHQVEDVLSAERVRVRDAMARVAREVISEGSKSAEEISEEEVREQIEWLARSAVELVGHADRDTMLNQLFQTCGM